MARIFDTFVRQQAHPQAGQRSKQLADALGVTLQAAQPVVKQYVQSEVQRGYEANLMKSAAMVREGKQQPTDNSFYMRGWSMAAGEGKAAQDAIRLHQAYQDEGIANVLDPTAAQQFFQGKLTEYASELSEDPHARGAYIAKMQGRINELTSTHISHVNNNMRQQRVKTVQDVLTADLLNLTPDNTEDMGQLFRERFKSNYNTSGLSGGALRDAFADAVINDASSSNRVGAIDILLSDRELINSTTEQRLMKARSQIVSAAASARTEQLAADKLKAQQLYQQSISSETPPELNSQDMQFIIKHHPLAKSGTDVFMKIMESRDKRYNYADPTGGQRAMTQFKADMRKVILANPNTKEGELLDMLDKAEAEYGGTFTPDQRGEANTFINQRDLYSGPVKTYMSEYKSLVLSPFGKKYDLTTELSSQLTGREAELYTQYRSLLNDAFFNEIDAHITDNNGQINHSSLRMELNKKAETLKAALYEELQSSESTNNRTPQTPDEQAAQNLLTGN